MGFKGCFKTFHIIVEDFSNVLRAILEVWERSIWYQGRFKEFLGAFQRVFGAFKCWSKGFQGHFKLIAMSSREFQWDCEVFSCVSKHFRGKSAILFNQTGFWGFLLNYGHFKGNSTELGISGVSRVYFLLWMSQTSRNACETPLRGGLSGCSRYRYIVC